MPAYDIIIAPIVTEKSLAAQKLGKYSFYVRPSANKIELAKAISSIYGVTVNSVNFTKLPEKTRLVRRGKTVVKRPKTVKAIVTLKKGQNIDFTKVKDIK